MGDIDEERQGSIDGKVQKLTKNLVENRKEIAIASAEYDELAKKIRKHTDLKKTQKQLRDFITSKANIAKDFLSSELTDNEHQIALAKGKIDSHIAEARRLLNERNEKKLKFGEPDYIELDGRRTKETAAKLSLNSQVKDLENRNKMLLNLLRDEPTLKEPYAADLCSVFEDSSANEYTSTNIRDEPSDAVIYQLAQLYGRWAFEMMKSIHPDAHLDQALFIERAKSRLNRQCFDNIDKRFYVWLVKTGFYNFNNFSVFIDQSLPNSESEDQSLDDERAKRVAFLLATTHYSDSADSADSIVHPKAELLYASYLDWCFSKLSKK